jgi:RNase adapter protein RapZ
MSPKRIIVITGLSGSGKSTAAHALEDEGFFVVDNLPLALLPQFLTLAEQGARLPADVAVVIDIRNRDFLAGLESTLQSVRESGYQLEIFFFDAVDDILIRRYSETRRRHPLTLHEGVSEGIRRERRLLGGLRNLATQIIDSSRLTPHQLRSKVVQIVRGEEGLLPMVVQLQSFGFRYGIPPESDLVIDVRFLPNPHFVPELQGQTGLDPLVSEYVIAQPACREFLVHLQGMLQFLLPHYHKEGKSYLTISIGCTGGRHRSVAIVEALLPSLAAGGSALKSIHRDIEKR